MAVHKCCTFRLKRKNLLSPTPDACCALLALRSIQLMTGEPPVTRSSYLARVGPVPWTPFDNEGRVTHICVSKLIIIGSDNGLSPGRRQAIIWTNAGILLIEPLGTNFIEIRSKIQNFSFMKMHLKMSSAKWRLFRLGHDELISPQRSGTELFRFNAVNIIIVDVLTPCVFRTSEPMILIMYNKKVFVLHYEGFKLPVQQLYQSQIHFYISFENFGT